MTNKKGVTDGLAMIIFNHKLNEEAIALKELFKNKADTFLFDSGSVINHEQQGHFDKIYDNIYYNGLMNEAWKFLNEKKYRFCMILTSDVLIEDASYLINRLAYCFDDKKNVGIYAPSADEGFHTHTVYNPNKELDEVIFTDGFCFAFRTEVLNRICPIDLELNKYGFGTNRMMGFYSLRLGYKNVIDHTLKVSHPYGSGYNKDKAVKAKNNWIKTFNFREKLYYKIASKNMFKNKVGLFLCRNIARRF